MMYLKFCIIVFPLIRMPLVSTRALLEAKLNAGLRA